MLKKNIVSEVNAIVARIAKENKLDSAQVRTLTVQMLTRAEAEMVGMSCAPKEVVRKYSEEETKAWKMAKDKAFEAWWPAWKDRVDAYRGHVRKAQVSAWNKAISAQWAEYCHERAPEAIKPFNKRQFDAVLFG